MRLSFLPGKASDDARRLTSCIIGADDPTGNLAHEAVSAVELQLLQGGWPVGEALGALPDVQKDLGLGRPACREAMIILEARGLLDVRRGPGGGLFVAAPTAEDVVGAMLMYLTLSGANKHCIQEFRLLVWRMIVEAAIDRGVATAVLAAGAGQWGFAVDLAQRIGNPAMALAAQIAEMLVRACEGRPAPALDFLLERALRLRDTHKAFARLEDMANPMDLAAPLLALEAMERSFAWAGRKSAMALAARMTREMMLRPEKPEAEWETAERLGYSDAVVRQARRILQDFGVVRCQRGRKGALWGVPASPAGVIRLLAPCLIASGTSARDNAEAANFLACNGPRLAAGRAAENGWAQTKVLGSFANSLELIDMIQIENLLLALAGNPLLSIMTRSLGLANLVSPGAKISLHRRVEVMRINHRILRAIEAGDAEKADFLARAKGEIQQSEASYQKLA
jgi:DNA-binding FadR family transcriptional regulator